MKVLMPLMGVLLVLVAVYSMRNGEAGETLRFLFVPDFDELSGRGVLDALGPGFFSIGVGLGILITYAPPQADLKLVALAAEGADTVVSLVAGLAVFPVVFSNGLDVASGPGLVFESLPLAFGPMPGGDGVLCPVGDGRSRFIHIDAGGLRRYPRPAVELEQAAVGRSGGGCRLRSWVGEGVLVQPLVRRTPFERGRPVRDVNHL